MDRSINQSISQWVIYLKYLTISVGVNDKNVEQIVIIFADEIRQM